MSKNNIYVPIESISREEKIIKNPCESCLRQQKKTESNYYCKDCKFYFCSNCDLETHKPFILKDHIRKPIQNSITFPTSNLEIIDKKCLLHSEILIKYCITCQKIICNKCLESICLDHEILDFQHAINKFIKEKLIIQELEKKYNNEKELNKLLVQEIESIKKEEQELKEDLSSNIIILEEILARRKKQLQIELNDYYDQINQDLLKKEKNNVKQIKNIKLLLDDYQNLKKIDQKERPIDFLLNILQIEKKQNKIKQKIQIKKETEKFQSNIGLIGKLDIDLPYRDIEKLKHKILFEINNIAINFQKKIMNTKMENVLEIQIDKTFKGIKIKNGQDVRVEIFGSYNFFLEDFNVVKNDNSVIILQKGFTVNKIGTYSIKKLYLKKQTINNNLSQFQVFTQDKFDHRSMGEDIVLSTKQNTISTIKNINWNGIKGTKIYQKGLHIFRFHLDSFNREGNILIGISSASMKKGVAFKYRKAWLYNCLDGTLMNNFRKIKKNGENFIYGEKCKTADTLNLILNMDQHTITFEYNDRNLKVAFTDISNRVRIAIDMYGKSQKLSII
ncbi:tripartite motif-containing 59-related [Anaeramoeba flamelloides]|uniref:Tripartite motif-containing 59-related n=1 Tax=Anaeramoeba flamelloides TaxID=1746091 RepID=A0ABQ8Z0T6_9EUKA|nr:tripartite motif-containing 59-related [Anaeramoeba flamelloides]